LKKFLEQNQLKANIESLLEEDMQILRYINDMALLKHEYAESLDANRDSNLDEAEIEKNIAPNLVV